MNGETLKITLKKMLISNKDLADKMNESPQNILEMFNRKSVGSDRLEKICRALGIKMNDLYKDTDLYQEVNPAAATATLTYDDPEKEIISLRAENKVLREILNLKEKEKIVAG